MNPPATPARATLLDKLFLPLFIIFGLMRAYEYMRGGNQLDFLLSAAGFFLMAFGTWSRALAPVTAENFKSRKTGAMIGTFGGLALILASWAMRSTGG